MNCSVSNILTTMEPKKKKNENGKEDEVTSTMFMHDPYSTMHWTWNLKNFLDLLFVCSDFKPAIDEFDLSFFLGI